MRGIIKKFTIWFVLVFFGVLITLFSIAPLRSQIMEIAGIAVAETTVKWNHLKDAAVGDNQTTGVAATQMYLFDGTNMDRARGTGGALNVSSVGSVTPSDAYANPTTALQSYSLGGMYNGATWDRIRGDTTNGQWVNVKTTVAPTLNTTTTVASTTMSTGQVAVDTTAGGTLIKASNANRRAIIIRNGATDIYVGNTGVATGTGLLLKADESLVLDRTSAAVYGITAAGSSTVSYLEE